MIPAVLSFSATISALLLCVAPALAAPQPPSLNAKAIRTLVYEYNDIRQEAREGHSSGIGSGYSHVASALVSGSWHGTITVEVLGVATDGALNVRMTEEVDHVTQKQPVWLCSTYPTMYAKCADQEDPELNTSAPEDIVLELLAPNFIDGSKMDDANHWQLVNDYKDVKRTTDFTVTANKGGILTLSGQRQSLWFPNVKGASVLNVIYDMKRTAPLSIHMADSERGSSRTMDMKLVRDSLAPVP